jgi:hypothetical protein
MKFISIKLESKSMSEITARIDLVKQIDTFSECVEEAIRIGSKILKKTGITLTEGKLAGKLDIDGGHWSRMMAGNAHFPPDKIAEMCKILRNDLVLEWLAYRQGYELRVIPKTLEEKLIEKERVIEEQARKIQNYEECFAKLGAKIKE